MIIQQKVQNFIKYCNCISEFDKYFWLSKLPNFDEETLIEMYEVLLGAEKELIHVELESIGKVKDLIDNSYPELKEEYLPNYQSLFKDYQTINREMSIDEINKIREEIRQHIDHTKF